ncbi:hypothetical protein [Parasphingorhabdus sp.]|uniref:hypothetical protein n=1 Tax=Parasphingorhabdus sp. TaxID=2709688 RepID=UPI003A91A40C
MIRVPLSVGYATSVAAELTAGPMLALTRTAAAKTAAKAAATWFWMLLLIILKFLLGLICCFTNHFAKMPIALHGACQFKESNVYQ